MGRKIKFTLKNTEGKNITTLEELRTYGDLKCVVESFYTQKLMRWLEDRKYLEELELLSNIDINDVDFIEKLVTILGLQQADIVCDIDTIKKEQDKLVALKEYKKNVQNREDARIAELLEKAFLEGETDLYNTYQLMLNNPAMEERYVYTYDFLQLNVRFYKVWREKRNFPIEWYIKASDFGDSKAKLILGYCYLYGIGVTNSNKRAFQLFNEASELGSLEALFELGELYTTGNGVKKDVIKAMEIYEKVLESGGFRARSDLGVCYINENIHLEKGRRLICEAVDQGSVHAYFNYGLGLAYGVGGFEKNIERGLEYIIKSSDADFTLAQFELANMYFEGNLVIQSHEKCLSLMKTIGEKDYYDEKIVLARRYVADFYNSGIGTEINYEEAVKWYEKSLETGIEENNLCALYRLGLCYEVGNGVDKDYYKAKEYYQRALEEGYKDENVADDIMRINRKISDKEEYDQVIKRAREVAKEVTDELYRIHNS